MQHPRALVSIVCITDNHEQFIQQALEGLLMQQTDLPIEIIVHDDASTDRTAAIISAYEAAHPGLIRSILQSRNQYSQRGFGFLADILQQAEGRYIAFCEGDDYWLDPHKLQRQVEYLENDDSLVIVGHRVRYIDGDNPDPHERTSPEEQPISALADILDRNYLPTASVLLRRSAMPEPGLFAESVRNLRQGDWPLFVLTARQGKILFMNQVLAAYRLHGSSLWSSLDAATRLAFMLQARDKLYRMLPEYSRLRHAEIRSRLQLTCANELVLERRRPLALLMLLRATAAAPWKVVGIAATQAVIPTSLGPYRRKLARLRSRWQRVAADDRLK